MSHLELCYDSLRNQSYKEFKIILVDNNSADDSVKYTEKNYPEVIILKLNTNTGFSFAARNSIDMEIRNSDCAGGFIGNITEY